MMGSSLLVDDVVDGGGAEMVGCGRRHVVLVVLWLVEWRCPVGC